MSAASRPAFDRFALVGDIAASGRRVLRKSLLAFAALLAALTAYLMMSGRPGAAAFGMIAAGVCLGLFGWKEAAIGLPLLPVLLLQHLVAYGMPLLTSNPVVTSYSEDYLTRAGEEVLIFCVAMILAWHVGMRTFRPGPPVSHALSDFNRAGGRKMKVAGFCLAGAAAGYLVLQSLGAVDLLMNLLPTGSSSAATAIIGAVGTCGFFLLAMLAGGGELNPAERGAFWLLLFVHCFISAASFLLSTVIFMIFSAAMGLFWSSGRVPWRFLLVVFLTLGFLNLGKYPMRDRYWKTNVEGGDPITQFTLSQMPGTYTEWVSASIDALSGGQDQTVTWRTADDKQIDSHSILDRINNLQNLLYVIDVMDRRHIAPLNGETYLLIPPLMVPRILWPDKPRTHAGQVRLNVYFGRQDMVSTFSTYVAWGLLPEAFGNFGAVWGSVILGGVLGLFFAWIENATARKMVLSLEGFLGFALFLGIANSVEMVASVLVTSVLQAVEPIAIAALPFVHRTANRRAPSAPVPPA